MQKMHIRLSIFGKDLLKYVNDIVNANIMTIHKIAKKTPVYDWTEMVSVIYDKCLTFMKVYFEQDTETGVLIPNIEIPSFSVDIHDSSIIFPRKELYDAIADNSFKMNSDALQCAILSDMNHYKQMLISNSVLESIEKSKYAVEDIPIVLEFEISDKRDFTRYYNFVEFGCRLLTELDADSVRIETCADYNFNSVVSGYIEKGSPMCIRLPEERFIP